MTDAGARKRLSDALRSVGRAVELSKRRSDLLRVDGEVCVVLESKTGFTSLIDASKFFDLIEVEEHETLKPIRYFILSPKLPAALVIESVTAKTWIKTPQRVWMAPSCAAVELNLDGRPQAVFRIEDLMRLRIPTYSRITTGEYRYLHELETGALPRDHGRFGKELRAALEALRTTLEGTSTR